MAISGGAYIGASIASALLSGAFSAGSAAYSNKKSSKQARDNMLLQANLTRYLNQNAYQDTMYSMDKAGINPMLVINHGINGLSAGSAPNPTMSAATFDFDLVNALNSAKQVKNDTQRVENETKLADYQSDLAHEQAANFNENTRLLQSFGEKQRKAEIETLQKQGRMFDAQASSAIQTAINNTRMTNSQINLNSASALAQKASANSHPYKDFSTNVIQPLINSAKKGNFTYKNFERNFNHSVHHFLTGN